MLIPTRGDFRFRRRAKPRQNRKAASALFMTADPVTGFTSNGVRCGTGVHMVAKIDLCLNRAFSLFINAPETYPT
jgi:hypothetical protein